MVRRIYGARAAALLILASTAASAKAGNCSAAQGQLYIDAGKYTQAVHEFTCIINSQPTEVEGYRGRIEAQVLLRQYSNAVRDYARVTALVTPVHPDAQNTILAGYAARLKATPNDIPALKGFSFARWWFFAYAHAIQVLNDILAIAPDDPYANLFRGSSRLSSRMGTDQGVTDLERAILLDPANPHVRFIVADAYTYGQPDANRAFQEASLALNWGLDTPRIHAILAASYAAFGNTLQAAAEIKTSIDQVTTQIVTTGALVVGSSMTLGVVPGRVYEVPVAVSAGQKLTVLTSSRDFWDTILVALAPDGSPVVGSDDAVKYYASLDWTAPVTATYRIRVTSFESVNTGDLIIERK